MSEFITPDWTQPIHLEELLAVVPAEAKIKGIFFSSAIRAAQNVLYSDLADRKYQALINYPTTELINVLVECSKALYPNLSLREALRHLGQNAFPALKETAAGTFLFSVAGRNFKAAVNLTSRAYKLFSTNVTANVVECGDSDSIIELRNVWTFPDSYHVGIFEGAMRAYNYQGKVTVKYNSLCDVDIKISINM